MALAISLFPLQVPEITNEDICANGLKLLARIGWLRFMAVAQKERKKGIPEREISFIACLSTVPTNVQVIFKEMQLLDMESSPTGLQCFAAVGMKGN